MMIENLDPFKLTVLFFLCHFVGDFILQSDYMALNKSKKTINCLTHVIIYTSCFLLITLSWKALLFIGITHFIIDRFPIIVKKLIWYKNHINPTLTYLPFKYCDTTGYYDDSPYNTYKTHPKEFGKPRHFFITIWLYIITDNTLHLICNFIAIAYLTK